MDGFLIVYKSLPLEVTRIREKGEKSYKDILDTQQISSRVHACATFDRKDKVSCMFSNP